MKKSTENILQLWKNWQKSKNLATKKITDFHNKTIVAISLDGEFIAIPKFAHKIKTNNSEIELF